MPETCPILETKDLLLAITEQWVYLINNSSLLIEFVLSVNLYQVIQFTSSVFNQSNLIPLGFRYKSQITWSDAEWKTKGNYRFLFSTMNSFEGRLKAHLIMTQLSRGRPSIAESELPQNIKIALATRVTERPGKPLLKMKMLGLHILRWEIGWEIIQMLNIIWKRIVMIL